MSKKENWKAILEGLLFAAGDEGLTLKAIASVFEVSDQEANERINQLMNELADDRLRGLQIIEIAGTYQLTTKKELANYLKKLVETPSSHSLSQASLETLAIIAYKQPITRIEIEEIRGVKTERPLQTLVAKALIKEVGRAEGNGRAYLYGTTKVFLDTFGLKSIKELPQLPDQGEEEFEQTEADLFFDTLNNV